MMMPQQEPVDAGAEPDGLPSQTRPANTVLVGPLGLRAGWGMLLYLMLSLLLGYVLVTTLFRATEQFRVVQQREAAEHREKAVAQAEHRQPVPQPLPLVATSLFEAAEAGGVVLAGLGLALLERRRFGVYGLALERARDLLPGAAVGLAAIGLLVGALRATHLLVFDGQRLHGAAAWRFGAGWLGAFLLVGLFEEFLFRGYLQFTLTRGLLGAGEALDARDPRRAAFWLATVLLSLIFGLVHLSNGGEDPLGIVMVVGAGLLFGYALWRTGSLWWGIGFHMTWDWGQSFLFGVPDSGTVAAGRLFQTHPQGHPLLSGGQAGPEGSLLVLPVLLLVAGVLRLHRRRPQPPVEPRSLPPAGEAVRMEAIP